MTSKDMAMKRIYLLALAATAAWLAASLPTTAAESDEGFKSIFNGKDLTGWNGNPQFWSVKDGAIVGQTTAENPTKGNTFIIWTGGEVADFELRLSYMIAPGNDRANTGIQYRSKVLNDKTWAVGGYQADMEAGQNYSGILYDEGGVAGGRGIMAARGEKVVWDKDCKKQVTGTLGKSEELQTVIKPGDWNEYVIIARGNHFQHFINGRQMVDVTDECEAKAVNSGVLALQLHAGPPMMVSFKNIRLKTLSGGSSAADDLRQMQGVWEVASAEANGQTIPGDALAGIKVTVRDNTYETDRGDEVDRGTLKLDPARQPKQMDVLPGNGSDAGRSILAIYEVGAETMRVCYATQGGSRPAAFKTEPDSGHILVNYKRKKP